MNHHSKNSRETSGDSFHFADESKQSESHLALLLCVVVVVLLVIFGMQ